MKFKTLKMTGGNRVFIEFETDTGLEFSVRITDTVGSNEVQMLVNSFNENWKLVEQLCDEVENYRCEGSD